MAKFQPNLSITASQIEVSLHSQDSETVHLIAFDVQPVADDYVALKMSAVPDRLAFDLLIAIDAQHDLLGVVERLSEVEGITPFDMLATNKKTTT